MFKTPADNKSLNPTQHFAIEANVKNPVFLQYGMRFLNNFMWNI